MTNLDSRTRWLALFVLCLGDVTIVGVALPSIREDLGFTESSLAWIVNGYMLTFGGFLLLGGRLGDLFGQRRLFLAGLGLFTAASLACGLATSQAALIAARAVQGLGGAIVAAVALALIMTLFTEPGERAKAMGVIGFVAAGGGSIGVLAGGVLTDVLNWHWIFLVNVPVGIAVMVLSLLVIPGGRGQAQETKLDIGGAVTVTGSLMLAVYAIVNGNEVGWTTARTLGLLAVAAVLFGVFLWIEARATSPLVPLGLFRLRNLSTANVVGILWSAAMFARAPVDGAFFVDVLPSMLILGIGVGMAMNPVLLAAMSDAPPEQAGLASGVVNTAFMMGGALGLAVLASLAAWRSDDLLASGDSQLAALTGGYNLAFVVGPIFAAVAAAVAAALLRPSSVPVADVHGEPEPCPEAA